MGVSFTRARVTNAPRMAYLWSLTTTISFFTAPNDHDSASIKTIFNEVTMEVFHGIAFSLLKKSGGLVRVYPHISKFGERG